MVRVGELVMIMELHRQGLSLTAIGRQLGIDRKTVRRYIALGLEPPTYGPRAPRPRATDAFLPYLRDRLAAYPGLTAVRLCRELRQHGFAGSYTGVKRAVRKLPAHVRTAYYAKGYHMLLNDKRVKPHRVCVDHVEEHTVRLALDNGFWCGMTLYPITKCTPSRSADILEMYGPERILVNSAGDWGHSDPLAVPALIQEMKRRGHSEDRIDRVVYRNPLEFWEQSNNWKGELR